jgi:allatostatin C receptor
MALISSSPEFCQSKLEITIFILVGCLGYSNSAMNPILYAFLSDNFKKSFMKAFTCAKTKEINAQLQAENSFFPRFGRGRNSECLSSKPTTNLVVNVNSQVKHTQSNKVVNTVESIVDATENGHTKNGHQLNNCRANLIGGEDESDDDEQELQTKPEDNSICIINSSNGTSKAPVLHTDL